MREIKFRLWCKNKNDWESNDWAILPDGSLVEIKSNGVIPISNKTHRLMQYTGLKDKNGKEIYEGDIVRTKRESKIKGYVTMYQGCWCICHYYTYYKLFYSFADAEPIEVIGNIYENPELLES